MNFNIIKLKFKLKILSHRNKRGLYKWLSMRDPFLIIYRIERMLGFFDMDVCVKNAEFLLGVYNKKNRLSYMEWLIYRKCKLTINKRF